jgi:hypothetical protein
MADHFDASLAGFADWLPYAGRHKSPGTITQYVTAARRLAAWGRAQGRQGFAELTKADLRAFARPGRQARLGLVQGHDLVGHPVAVRVPGRGRGRPGYRQGDHRSACPLPRWRQLRAPHRD